MYNMYIRMIRTIGVTTSLDIFYCNKCIESSSIQTGAYTARPGKTIYMRKFLFGNHHCLVYIIAKIAKSNELSSVMRFNKTCSAYI